jgi:hypothetical protein
VSEKSDLFKEAGEIRDARKARAKKAPKDEKAATGEAFDPKNRDARWFLAPVDEIHTRVMSRVRRLRNRQRARREMYRYYLQLYGVNEFTGLGLTNYEAASIGFVAPSLPYNVVRRGVNTVAARVARHKPLPMVLTTRGNYRQTKRARSLSNFGEGAFLALDVFPKTAVMVRDALTLGPGLLWIHHYPQDKMPRVDRVLAWELFVDIGDAHNGDPTQLWMVRWEDRVEFESHYPGANELGEDRKDIIERSGSTSGLIDDMPDYEQGLDRVLVTRCWRLPYGDKPGRYFVGTDGGLIEQGEYTKSHFPLVMLGYVKPMIGFWPDGLAAEMSGFQEETNYATETVRMGMRMVGTGIWMVPDGGDIVDSHFVNETGYILKYRLGFEPKYYNPDPVNAQTIQYQQQSAEGALSWSGISQMSANAEKPAGITANVALETLDDLESDNFALFEQAYEDVHVQIFERLIEEFKEMHEENPDLAVFAPQRRELLEVKWADVDMPRDQIVIRIWPTNLLGRTPAARRQTVTDLFNDGIIDRTLYLRLIDAPDIDAETDLESAMTMLADDQIDFMLNLDEADVKKAGSYKRPGPYQDLTYAARRAQQQVCLGELTAVPEPILDMLRQYIEDCVTELQKKMAPPGTTPAPTPGAGPQANAPVPPPGAAPPPGPPPPPQMGVPPPPAQGAMQ